MTHASLFVCLMNIVPTVLLDASTSQPPFCSRDTCKRPDFGLRRCKVCGFTSFERSQNTHGWLPDLREQLLRYTLLREKTHLRIIDCPRIGGSPDCSTLDCACISRSSYGSILDRARIGTSSYCSTLDCACVSGS
jgi:hypothetical protein